MKLFKLMVHHKSFSGWYPRTWYQSNPHNTASKHYCFFIIIYVWYYHFHSFIFRYPFKSTT